MARLDELIRRAVRDQGAVLTTHPGQWAAVRSFVPGEHDPTTTTGFVREVPAALAATWGPNTGTRVLDEVRPLPRLDDPARDHPGVLVAAGRAGARAFRASASSAPSRAVARPTRRPPPGSSRCGWATSRTCSTPRACCAACSSCPPCAGPSARSTCSTPPRGCSRRGGSCPSRAPTTTPCRASAAALPAAGPGSAVVPVPTRPGGLAVWDEATEAAEAAERRHRRDRAYESALRRAPTRSAAASPSSSCSAGCRPSSSRTAPTRGSSCAPG